MTGNNTILSRIEAAIGDHETPGWAIPILLCIRDDHAVLHGHLQMHSRIEGTLSKIALAVSISIAVAFVLWVLSARFPGVFS